MDYLYAYLFINLSETLPAFLQNFKKKFKLLLYVSRQLAPSLSNWFPKSFSSCYTVKRVDGKVWHPELVTQDRFIRVWRKVLDIPDHNFNVNIKLFQQTIKRVDLLR